MARPKVCVSFDYENDKYSRNAIRLWNENKYIDFDIIDKTPSEIDTYNISRIKAGLTVNVNIKMHKKGKISVYKKGNKICPISVYSLQTSLWFKTSLVR